MNIQGKKHSTVRVSRAFISLCQLEYTPDSSDDKRYEKYQLTLVAILTTLCTSARNDFLIFDRNLNRIILWKNGMELMRNCYCNRLVAVDRTELLKLRDAFFVQYRWFYDPARCIARNHQLTGDYDQKYIKANHLEESAKWKLRVGSQDYLAATVDIFPPGIPDDDQLEKKKRSGKAKKARLESLAVDFGIADEVAVAISKKPKKAKTAVAAVVSSPSLSVFSKVLHVPVVSIPPASVNPKVQSITLRKASMEGPASAVLPKSSFEDVRAIVQAGDLMEEAIKQEARLKLVAAKEQAKLEIERAKEIAKVQADAFKLEEERIIGAQQLAKQQNLLNNQNEGILFHAVYSSHKLTIMLCS